jgi:hypothetical protein
LRPFPPPAIARYGGEIDWSSLSSVVYVAVLIGVLGLSVFGLMHARSCAALTAR